jgi:hypothetical protein
MSCVINVLHKNWLGPQRDLQHTTKKNKQKKLVLDRLLQVHKTLNFRMIAERYLNHTEWLAVRFMAVGLSLYLT